MILLQIVAFDTGLQLPPLYLLATGRIADLRDRLFLSKGEIRGDLYRVFYFKMSRKAVNTPVDPELRDRVGGIDDARVSYILKEGL